jgi:EAL and modified HD-GYP domain-containing signal transduction protein
MNSSQVFAYQPIVDTTQTPVAVELIYRNGVTADDIPRTVANVVLDAFIHAGPGELPRRRLTYFSAPASLLESGLLDQLPSEQFALQLQPADLIALQARFHQLKQAGYCMVLNGTGDDADHLRQLLPFLNVIRLDAKAALNNAIPLLAELRTSGLQLLAGNVDSREMADDLKALGFSLFQGYYFASPANHAVTRADPRKLAVLELLSKLTSDADDPIIEDAFKANPSLALHLLQIVNSSAFALKTRIRSIKHAFAILGRKQLENWLHVLLFSIDGDGVPSPLMELALRRARFMEFVLIYRTHKSSTVLQDEAYLTGLLSLVNIQLGWSMAETVARLNLTDEIRQALLHREGTLGQLIDLCETLEIANFEAALPIAEALHLPLEAVMTAQNVALSYSVRIGQKTAEESSD